MIKKELNIITQEKKLKQLKKQQLLSKSINKPKNLLKKRLQKEEEASYKPSVQVQQNQDKTKKVINTVTPSEAVKIQRAIALSQLQSLPAKRDVEKHTKSQIFDDVSKMREGILDEDDILCGTLLLNIVKRCYKEAKSKK